MSGWTVLLAFGALLLAYKLGRATKAYSQYVRGFIDGDNAHRAEHVEAQRENAAKGLR